MKKKLLPILLLILISGMSFAQIRTFKVTVPETTLFCYIAGDFNGWDPAANEMNKISDSPKVFTLDVDIPDSLVATTKYKYLSGPSWDYQQTRSADF